MKVAHYLMAVCKSRQRRQVKVPGGWQGGPPRLVDIMAESTCTSLYYCAPLSHQPLAGSVAFCLPLSSGSRQNGNGPAEPGGATADARGLRQAGRQISAVCPSRNEIDTARRWVHVRVSLPATTGTDRFAHYPPSSFSFVFFFTIIFR